MANKNELRLSTEGLEGLMQKLARLEHATARATVEQALQKVAEKVNADTVAALDKGNLPAKGKYSTGTTARSVNTDMTVRWEGMTAWIPVGFDFNLPGAGGYLISGTPKMQPVSQLRKMYRQKTYMREINRMLWEELFNHINEVMEG